MPYADAASLLTRSARALADDGAPRVERYVERGTASGAGLSGTFTVWHDGPRERDDENLGPKAQRTYVAGDRVHVADGSGVVRELTGPSLRRVRTERLIASGEFATTPGAAAARGEGAVDGRHVVFFDVAAVGGERERLAIDPATALPVQLSFDDADARETIAYSDWRSVAGRRYPFTIVTSQGDAAYAVTEHASAIEPDEPIPTDVFAVPATRTIEMTGPETIGLEAIGGHLIVPVRIDGRPLRFLLDSGAQSIVVDLAAARTLGIAGVGSFEVSGTARTGGLGVARLGALQIGGGVLRDLVVSTLDLAGATHGTLHVDGILGYPFFSEALVRLDPVARTMTFGRPGSFAPEGMRIPASFDRAFPEATLGIGAGLRAPFVIDTGNAGDVLLYKPFVDRHPGLVPFSTLARSSDGIGGRAAAYRTAIHALTLGELTARDVPADVMLATSGAFADRDDAGNVGLSFLARYVVTFDEADHAVWLLPRAAAATALP